MMSSTESFVVNIMRRPSLNERPLGIMVRPWIWRQTGCMVQRCCIRGRKQSNGVVNSLGPPRWFASPPRSSRGQRLQHQASLSFAKYLVGGIAVLSGGISAVVMAQMEDMDEMEELQPLRTESFALTSQNHKTTVRLFKVDRKHDPMQSLHEYAIHLTLISSDADESFLTGDNRSIISTDAQHTFVQGIAQRHSFDSPEELGMIVAQCILLRYTWLDEIIVQVDETLWERARVDGQCHAHGFVPSPHGVQHHATIHLARGQGPILSSSLSNMVLFKSTQSGFEGFYRDEYTELRETKERCLSTRLEAVWTCTYIGIDARL